MYWFIRVKTWRISITNITAQGCCKLAWLATWKRKAEIIYNRSPPTVFDLLGQSSNRNVSPSLPLQPYNPAASTVSGSMRPAPRKPLFPFSNGFRQPHASSRPSNSSPNSGILGGNPPWTCSSSQPSSFSYCVTNPAKCFTYFTPFIGFPSSFLLPGW